MDIKKYNAFEKLNENDRLSLLTQFRVFIDSYINHKYRMHTNEWEKIISYSENGLWIDSFMIWKICENSNWKRFFNLEYIYSITGKWAGTKLLLTYINKNEIKNISYLPTWWYTFWEKVIPFLEGNNIITKIPFDNNKFQ